ncbi:hypothetical protein EPO15_15940 [bacterium]|nr:MAG: hypothetical protein EPO15_15940 [bacterium]
MFERSMTWGMSMGMPNLYTIGAPMSERADRLYFFFATVYLAQGLIGVAYEPISYLLKDGLGLGPGESATFIAWMTLPFLFKPLIGLVGDALPLGGRRRVPWLVLAGIATSAGWMTLATLPEYRYGPTLFLLTGVNVGVIFADVLCDGVMVERGKAGDKTGLYQAVQIGTLYACALATGFGGGWLAQHASPRAVFGLVGGVPLLVAAGALLVPEAPQPPGAARRTLEAARKLLADRSAWALAAVIFLVNFIPFQGTAFFFYQNDALHFSKVLIGALSSLDGFAGLAGAAFFWRFYNREVTVVGKTFRLTPGRLARLSALATIPMTLAYLVYREPFTAGFLTIVLGAAGVAARLSLMDLAARSVPEGGEAAGFALFMSVFNLAAWASNTVGAKTYGLFAPTGPHMAMATLILVSAATTSLALPLLRFIPLPDRDP